MWNSNSLKFNKVEINATICDERIVFHRIFGNNTSNWRVEDVRHSEQQMDWLFILLNAEFLGNREIIYI